MSTRCAHQSMFSIRSRLQASNINPCQTIDQASQPSRLALAVPPLDRRTSGQSSIESIKQAHINHTSSIKKNELAEGGGPAAASACGRPSERDPCHGWRRQQRRSGKLKARARRTWEWYAQAMILIDWRMCPPLGTHHTYNSRPLRPATSWSCRRSGRPSARPSAG